MLGYCDNLISEGDLAPEVLILSTALVDRVVLVLPEGSPIHFLKLIAVCVFVAQKYLHETSLWGIREYSELAGLVPEQLKHLEIELLTVLEFQVHLKLRHFRVYREELIDFNNQFSGAKNPLNSTTIQTW